MNQILMNCPVCSSDLAITRLECEVCNTAIEGQFNLGRLSRLTREQLQFVELLAQHRGNVNQVGASLGVSYTTARTRMDEIAASLGAPFVTRVDPREVLRQLESGDISAEEALERLHG